MTATSGHLQAASRTVAAEKQTVFVLVMGLVSSGSRRGGALRVLRCREMRAQELTVDGVPP